MEQKSIKKVLILQRAIPNYRLPLFQALCALKDFEITIGCAEHDEKTSTGIPADNYSGVRIKPVKIYKLGGKFFFQSIVSLKNYDLVITDISINVLSVPVYLLLTRLKGVKIIGWGKGVPQRIDTKESWLQKAYKKFIAGSCDALILYGHISKGYFEKLGLKNKPMFIAQNSVHTEKFFSAFEENEAAAMQLRTEMKLSDRFVFGYFGKLTGRKAVDNIIEAFRIVKKSSPNSFLLIAGSGPETNRLKQLAADLVEQGSVYFMGRVPNGKEGGVLHLIDGYLTFSQGGLGILEAMASRRTIISTPESFPETELLQGDENCFLSSDFSVQSFAQAMLKAVNNRQLALQMGVRAQQTVKEKAGTSVMVKAFADAINYTLSK
ncbi:MAG: glycosyltransferase family 4 protein [Ferruginibacter sp.]